ncbi:MULTISPECIES: hypothetical protein [unclassified Streptomyces]|uniref:hypothetical protein n=1 Tax=unclassified Streptomyces TaxID=2593676 RepID=UPI0033ED94E3
MAIWTAALSPIPELAPVTTATCVIPTYSSNEQGAKHTVARIQLLGGTAVALPLGIGDTAGFPAFREAVADALRETWQRGTFDHLVNNAGFAGMAMIQDTGTGCHSRKPAMMQLGERADAYRVFRPQRAARPTFRE